MIKRILSVIALVAGASILCSNVLAWTPKEAPLMTRWGKALTPETAWQSYPRPQLQRAEWNNLNGLWSCSITGQDVAMKNVAFDKEILVPFCAESALSGLAEAVTPTDRLWYKRTFSIDKSWAGKNIILHFGAVDYSCEVFVNGKSAGKHVGGNNAFSFDVTKFVKAGKENTLVVAVTDPTDTDTDTRGKQTLNPRGIWYTAVTGIWKTVWMEPVSATHIKSLVPTAKISGNVSFDINLASAKGGETVAIEILDGSEKVGSYEGAVSGASAVVSNPTLWCPENPKLYTVKATLKRAGKVLDEVDSYMAFREVSKITDAFGSNRVALNGEPIFQLGTLDQGWWPDGLLTPPSEEAMIFDMIELKKMGFNTIRKHIKVEPELYYYYADSLGIMIWQDMPSGFQVDKAKEQHVSAQAEFDWDAPAGHEAQWKYEYKEMYENLRFFPSITTWVVFNEGWGQFRTPEMTAYAQSLDNTRLYNSVSGWTDRNVGDFHDIHNYPSTSMKLPSECPGRISVLGEFGGLALAVDGHLWADKGWGYRNMDASLELMNNYARLCYDLEALASQGLSASIYTQTTDVEVEMNGLITYDREVVKLDEGILHMLHSKIYEAVPSKINMVVAGKPEGRMDVKANTTRKYSEKFDFDGSSRNISLWLNGNAKFKVALNGREIFNGPVRQTRNYNHFNISDHADAFVKGENEISFEIVNETPKKDTKFDFRITTY